MVLLYFLVVSLLVMGGFNASILQTKIATHFYEKAVALQNAESALIVGEAVIQGIEDNGSGDIAGASYTFQKRLETSCGVLYYQIDAIGKYQTAQSSLESILSVPISPSPVCPNAIPSRKRVAWQER